MGVESRKPLDTASTPMYTNQWTSPVLYEWDENKNIQNKAKHGVSFEQAVFALKDPRRRLAYDFDHSDETEDRWKVIGAAGGVVLFVVETERGDDTIRIITARFANSREKAEYYENC
jgi:uncharacterized DUF497 family protein